MYLTYAEYQVLGGIMTDTAFSLSEFKARRIIDGLTQGRVKSMATVPEEVKRCMFDLIGKIASENEANGGIFASESSGSYSYSYDSANAEAIKTQTVVTFLKHVTDDNGLYLLYAGVD